MSSISNNFYQGISFVGATLEESFFKTGQLLVKASQDTKGLKKFLKLLGKVGAAAQRVFGVAGAYPFTPQALNSLKNCKANLGAVEIVTRIRDWVCNEEGKQFPFWVKATVAKIWAQIFLTAANACVTIKYLNTVELISLANWTTSIGRIPVLGKLTKIPFLDIGFIKNSFKIVASTLDLIESNRRLRKLDQKKIKYDDNVKIFNLALKNISKIIGELNKGPEMSSSSSDLSNSRLRLRDFHVFRVLALTEERYTHSLPPALLTGISQVKKVGEKPELPLEKDIEGICRELDLFGNTPTPSETTPGNPETPKVKTEVEVVSEFTEAMQKILTYTKACFTEENIQEAEMEQIERLAARVERTAEKHLLSVSKTNPLSHSVLENFASKKFGDNIQKNQKAHKIANEGQIKELEELKKYYTSKIERTQAKIENLPALRSILHWTIADDVSTVLISSADLAMAIAGISTGVGFSLLQFGQAAVEFSRFAYESTCNLKKLPEVVEINSTSETPTPR